MPDALHAKLREQAQRNRRSVTKEAVTLIERGLVVLRSAPTLSPSIKLKGGPFTIDEMEAATAVGRE